MNSSYSSLNKAPHHRSGPRRQNRHSPVKEAAEIKLILFSLAARQVTAQRCCPCRIALDWRQELISSSVSEQRTAGVVSEL